MISINFHVIFIEFYVLLFCSAPLSSIVTVTIQIYFATVIEQVDQINRSDIFEQYSCQISMIQ